MIWQKGENKHITHMNIEDFCVYPFTNNTHCHDYCSFRVELTLNISGRNKFSMAV